MELFFQSADTGYIYPTVEIDDRTAGQQPLFGAFRRHKLLHTIKAQAKLCGVPTHRLDSRGFLVTLPRSLRDLLLQRTDVFPNRAAHILELGEAEPKGSECLQNRLLSGAVDDHLKIVLLTVAGQKADLTFPACLFHCAAHRVHIHAAGSRSEQDADLSGTLFLQREIKALPRKQCHDFSIQTGLPGSELSDGFGMLIDALSLFKTLLHHFSVKQFFLTDSAARREHAFLLRSVLAESLQRSGKLRQLSLDPRQIGGVTAEQRGTILVCRILRRLADLNAAHMKQTRQQCIPLLSKCDQSDPFHFDNGH